MKKVGVMMLGFLGCLTVVAAQIEAAEMPIDTETVYKGIWVEGYVTKLDFNQRLLTVSGQRFQVPIDAVVTSAFGGSYSFSQLQPDQSVRVIYHLDKQKRIAEEIQVLPPGQTPIQY